LRIRNLAEDDLPFLREMLYEAAFWRPDAERLPFDVALAHEQLARYHAGWGREGDLGVIAEHGGVRVGAAFCRLFTDADHGHGYIDDDTPELAIAVVHGHRARGIGYALMRAIADRARDAGIKRLALSVDPENPARQLYASLGYEDYHYEDEHHRMVLEL